VEILLIRIRAALLENSLFRIAEETVGCGWEGGKSFPCEVQFPASE